ncbi:sensor histidine kinase [Paenibacillus thalictri]|uniref:histidine kinase n=1 Tax=Paenibacillus thalictri TaxID=2527873 RepID=A0A4Q9DYH8_9BACL|nr:histidine kinase [Paenibacillus thalictri]TBL81160.1 HAMP domain-containing protein [Paenibacillus thalictri]
MKRTIRLFFPTSLRHRFLAIFLLFILFPFAAMQIYYYQHTEATIQTNIVEQNFQYLDYLKNELEQIKVSVLQSLILLEYDPELQEILEDRAALDEGIKGEFLSKKSQQITQIVGYPPNLLYYSIYDLNGNRYSIFPSEVNIRHDISFVSEEWFQRSFQSPYLWVLESSNQSSLKADSNGYITLYALLRNKANQPVGVARFGFQISGWLEEINSVLPVKQDYYLLDDQGHPIIRSKNAQSLSSKQTANALDHNGDRSYHIDSDDSRIISSIYLKSYGWTLVSGFDMARYLGDIRSMGKGFLTATITLTVAFVMMTYFLSSLVTRPLRNLQKQMELVAENNMHVHIREDTNSREIRQVTRSFNRMVDDVGQLIEQLKREERKKEALRFQMLLSQMDPHFLLNTLNTIKWIALDYKVNPIADICTNLGTLLESSLLGDVELIHLHREIELMKAFVSIQELRFGNRLQFDISAPDELKYALVPKFSLQPLVENAIRHGFSEMQQTGVIQISAYKNQNEIILKVSDNGSGFKPVTGPVSSRKGIGLNNLRERLSLLFKENAEFIIHSSETGTTVTIRMPLLLSTPFEEGEV